jgi:hypothetical protein
VKCVIALFGLLGISCGARTGLSLAAEEADSSPHSCTHLQVDVPFLTVATDGADLTQPNLVLIDAAHGTACLVYSQAPSRSAASSVTEVSCFPATGVWPPAQAAAYDAHAENDGGSVPGNLVMAAPPPAPAFSSFALLYGSEMGARNNVSPLTGFGATKTPWTIEVDFECLTATP